MKHLLTYICLIIAPVTVHAQEDEHHSESKGIIELIGVGVYAYSTDAKAGVYGTEFHLTYWFDHVWGSGVSYTAKLEETETLHDIALLGSWNPFTWMTLNVGPNFGLPGDHRDFELSFYNEAEINIRPNKWFHFGPTIGSIIGKHSEITTGIHIGFELH